MVKFRTLALVTASLLLLSFDVSAKKFSNSYIEFDMPDNWLCRSEGGQYVCQPSSASQSREAIVVMAAKHKGPDDEMERYKSRLNEKRTVKDIQGKEYKSTIKYTKYMPIKGVIWLDSMHESSEVPGFVTRYLATVQKGAGILVTFSAHKSVIDNYNAAFLQMVNSIKISDNIPAPEAPISPEMTKLGGNIVAGNVEVNPAVKKKDGKTETKGIVVGTQTGNNKLLYIIIAVVVILIIFMIMRRRKKRDMMRRR